MTTTFLARNAQHSRLRLRVINPKSGGYAQLLRRTDEDVFHCGGDGDHGWRAPKDVAQTIIAMLKNQRPDIYS